MNLKETILGKTISIVLACLVCVSLIAAEQKLLIKDKKGAYKLLGDKDAQRRSAAAAWISDHADLCDPALLIKALQKENDGEVQYLLLEALGKQNAADGIPLYLKFLNDERPIIRQGAAMALQSLTPPGADAQLSDTLAKETDRRVKLAVLYTLGKYSTETAVNAVASKLSDTTQNVAFVAAQQLDAMNREDADSYLALLRANQDPAIAQFADQAHKRIQDREKKRLADEALKAKKGSKNAR